MNENFKKHFLTETLKTNISGATRYPIHLSTFVYR